MASAARSFMLAGSLGLVVVAAPAAEWSVAPQLFFNADHESNRVLRADTPESQSLGVQLDVGLRRRSETADFSVAPRYYLRRITPAVEPDVDDLYLPADLRLTFERGELTLGALYADESTLTTELATTGAIQAGASRITKSTEANWQHSHSDAWRLNVFASYSDVNYTGDSDGRLYDYRYGALSAGERWATSERSAWTVTAFGSQLRSEARSSESLEAGVSLGFDFAWTENLQMSAAFGTSRREIDGTADEGYTGNFSLSRRGETREWRLALDHRLVPYGSGVLTERDSAELGITQMFGPRLDCIARLGAARNKDAASGFAIDTRTYRYSDLELRWRLAETWNLSLLSGYSDARDIGLERVSGWMVGLRTLWAPQRRVFGH